MGYLRDFGNLNGALFLFYLALISNYIIYRVMSPGIVQFFENSRLGTHIIAFFVLLFATNLYAPQLPFPRVVLYAVLVWLWFILTSKQSTADNMAILLLLLASYIAFNLNQDLDYNKKQTEDHKQKMRTRLEYFQAGCFVAIILVSIVGGYTYFMAHYKSYRKKDRTFGNFLWRYLSLARSHKREI